MKDCNTENFREKSVVDAQDGRLLGHVAEIIFDVCDGRITAVVVRAECSSFSFKKPEDIIIPWQRILKIGEDVILVQTEDRCPPPRPKKKEEACDSCGAAKL